MKWENLERVAKEAWIEMAAGDDPIYAAGPTINFFNQDQIKKYKEMKIRDACKLLEIEREEVPGGSVNYMTLANLVQGSMDKHGEKWVLKNKKRILNQLKKKTE